MIDDNPYLVVGIRGSFVLHEQGKVLNEGFGFEGLATAYSNAMGLVSVGDRGEVVENQWTQLEAFDDLTTPGDFVTRGSLRVVLPTGTEGDRFPGQDFREMLYPCSPPIFAASQVVWNALGRLGAVGLGGLDVDVPLWCVGNEFDKKILRSVPLVWGTEPCEVPLLVELAVRNASDGNLRRTVMNALSTFGPVFERHVELLPSTSTRRSKQADQDFTDRGVISVRVSVPRWSIETACWLAEVATLASWRAGLREPLSVAIGREPG